METKWYHDVKWLRTGHTVYELDETDTCNKFSVLIQGGWSCNRQGWVAGVKTTDAELDQYADLIHAAPETATQRDSLLSVNKQLVEALEGFKHADATDWDFLISLLNKSVRHSEDAETKFWIAAMKKTRAAILAAKASS